MTQNSVGEDPTQGILEAERERAVFADHGEVLGAAGYIDPNDQFDNADFLGKRGDTLAVTPAASGFGAIRIGAAWDPRRKKSQSFFGKLLKKTRKVNVDLDLGCLFELKNGQRGAIQAFGNLYGSYDQEPFIQLSGDERTGEARDDDETITINGARWNEIERLLVYIYIYDGARDWGQIAPQIQVRIPGQKPMVVSIASQHRDLGLCAIAGLVNVRGGISLTNHTEYFAGHAEMDRAFGYGLEWADGQKQPVSQRENP